jgi:rubrerythrin
MTPQLTLNEVLEGAIQKEVFSRFLYVGLRQKMKSQASKDAFKILADQEEIHQHVLEDYLHGKTKEGALSSKQDIDYKIADCLDQPEILPTMDLKDVFLLAAKKEKASHDLYHQLAEIHPEGIIKNLLNELSVQEIEHKQRIETIYTEVAFPQTDGG